MTSSIIPKADSPYREFTEKPINRFNSSGPPFDVPVTITDRDGTLIHEHPGQDLLYTIITHNDVEFLEKYFAIDPRAIPNLFQLPDHDEAICDFGQWFRFAAESGSLGTLQTLLTYTTKDLDTTEPIRLSRANFQLLNVAAQFGRIEIVQWLLDTQPLYASINDRDLRGFTALAAAADLFSFQSDGSPAWDEICYDNNEAIMNLLLDQGACASDVVRPTNNKDQKLPDVHQCFVPSCAVADARFGLFNLSQPHSVLTLAAQWASTDLLERLIDGGADVHYKVAVNTGELRIRSQRDVPVKIEIAALFLASFRANPNGVKTLTALVASLFTGRLETNCDTGLDSSPISTLHETAGKIVRTIGQLLDFAPTTINTKDNDGNTALHYATRYLGKNGKIYTPVFKLLCSRGADASLHNYRNETPLHTLFQPYDNSVPIDPIAVSLLIAHGAKVTDADDAGNTPLHAACSSVSFGGDAISVLLQHGADPALRNSKQDTPIHMAADFHWTPRKLVEVDEGLRAQDDMLDRLVEAGGAELMDLHNAAGKTARQIYHDSRAKWLKGARGEGKRGRGRGRQL